MPESIETHLPALPNGAEKIINLVHRCNTEKPRRRDIARLRDALQEYPDLWRAAGDLANLAANRFLDKAIVATPLTTESIKAGRLAIRRELGFDDATPLEQLLIEHITLAWIRLQITEIFYTERTSGEYTYDAAAFWDRRLSAAQRRYLRACESLARVRRLNLPSVQVNVGEKQVNVAGR